MYCCILGGFLLLFFPSHTLFFTCSSAVDMTFTTKNVQGAVQEVKNTNKLGLCLGVPELKRREIQKQFFNVPQQVKAYINYFMEHNPVASWRAVIVALDRLREKEAADAIRYLAEPVTGRAGSTTCTCIMYIYIMLISLSC